MATGGKGGGQDTTSIKIGGIGGHGYNGDITRNGHDGETFGNFPNGDGGVSGYVLQYSTTTCSSYKNVSRCTAGYQDNNPGDNFYVDGNGDKSGLDYLPISGANLHGDSVGSPGYTGNGGGTGRADKNGGAGGGGQVTISYDATSTSTSGSSGTPSFDNRGGFDGWIELSGDKHPTGDTSGSNGVTFDPTSGSFLGYAWGSTVLGWINFYSGINMEPVCIDDFGNCEATTTPPTVSMCSVTPPINKELDYHGGIFHFDWDSTGMSSCNFVVDGSSVSTATTSIGGYGYDLNVSENTTSNPINHIYTMVCTTSDTGEQRTCNSDTMVTIDASSTAPVLSTEGSGKMWVDNNENRTSTKIKVGQSAKINWNVNDFISEGYSCHVTGLPSNHMSININDSNSAKANRNPQLVSGLQKGIYTLGISCPADSDKSLSATSTNSVTVTVTDSIIHEK